MHIVRMRRAMLNIHALILRRPRSVWQQLLLDLSQRSLLLRGPFIVINVVVSARCGCSLAGDACTADGVRTEA